MFEEWGIPANRAVKQSTKKEIISVLLSLIEKAPSDLEDDIIGKANYKLRQVIESIDANKLP